MGYEVVYTHSFITEYRGVLLYLVDVLESPAAAGNLMDALDKAITILETTPEIRAISPARTLEEKAYRVYSINKYLLVYRIDGQYVYCEHLFHGSQNYEAYV